MIMKYKFIIYVLSLSFLAISCDRRRNEKGYEYFPDMAHSLAYETYAPNPNLPTGQSMLLPPAHTIPVEMEPYMYDATPEGRALAAKELVNPYTLTEEDLIRGKNEFQIFCAHCHGNLGDGKGFLYTSGRYTMKPASLLSDKMMAANASEIYHVITVGFQVMGPHGHMIRPRDRWMIAMYVKNELQKQ